MWGEDCDIGIVLCSFVVIRASREYIRFVAVPWNMLDNKIVVLHALYISHYALIDVVLYSIPGSCDQ